MTYSYKLSSIKKDKESSRYAIILAGGDGTRLKSLTKAISGDERPKQFCQILEDETLLDKTRQRIKLKIKEEDTFFSLTSKHHSYYRKPLSGFAENQLIEQPENKGTAPAILYSLLRLAASAPQGNLAFFPSDHYFLDDAAFMDKVEIAFRHAENHPQTIILLGIEPGNPETSYGWIEPDRAAFSGLTDSISPVKRFWEKPSLKSAQKLLSKGCLWNSFVMIGRVETFLRMIRRKLPVLYSMFVEIKESLGTSVESETISVLYKKINETNFSSEVLEKCRSELFVLPVGKVGWSDWGEPQRVLGALAALGMKTNWLSQAI